jgi:hypothetical protein
MAVTIEVKASRSYMEGVLSRGLTVARTIAVVLDQVSELVRRNFKEIGLDMVDRAGLGQMIGSFCQVSLKGSGLELAHLLREGREMLTLLHLETVLEVFESETAAVSSFAGLDTSVPVPAQPLGAAAISIAPEGSGHSICTL